jgi:Flp pilus assembly protein TadG
MILPVILLVLLGTIEVSRNIQFHQKLDSASNQMVNIINQILNLTVASASAIMDSAQEMMKPFDDKNIVIFITAVQQDLPNGQKSTVQWQIKRVPASTKYAHLKSKIAPLGQGSQIDFSLITLEQREQIITVELYVSPKLIIDSVLTRKILGISDAEQFEYKYAIGRPRFGSFQIPPS